jgi:isoamylase
MLLGGDELGRSQQGNNNAYCQDNEISWFDWGAIDESLLAFTRRVIAIQAEHPVFRRRRWFKGRPVRGAGITDIAWFRPDGAEMSDDDWQQDHAKCFAVFLNGDALRDVNEDGDVVRDDSVLLLFNEHHESVPFTMPSERFGAVWHAVLDTSSAAGESAAEIPAGETVEVSGRAVVVLARRASAQKTP